MLTINVYPSHLKLDPKPSAEVEALIKQAFSYPVPGAEHIQRQHRMRVHPKYVASCWRCNFDGNKSLYSRHTLPIGFHDDLIALCLEHGIQFENKYHLTKPERQYYWNCDFTLRDYQNECINAMLQAERGIVSSPTGSGKSKIIVQAIAEFGVPAIVVVPRKNIFVQFIKEFKDNTDIPVGEVGSGSWDDTQPVTVAIAATLSKYPQRTKELLADKQLLIVDEFHFSASATWQEIIAECPAYHRFGFSATPYRPNDLGDAQLKGLCGETVFEIATETLQAEGYLVPTDIRVIKLRCNPPAKVFDSTISEDTGEPIGWRTATYTKDKYREVISLNEKRNSVIADLIKYHVGRGEKVMCITAWDMQGQALLDMIEMDDAIYMSGKDTKKKTQEKMDAFTNAEGGVVCVGTSVLDCGLDLPSMTVLILGGEGTYSGRTRQQIGRGLRPCAGKEKVLVFDFWDSDEHTRKKHFSKHSQSRWDTYVELGQKPVLYESAEEAMLQL